MTQFRLLSRSKIKKGAIYRDSIRNSRSPFVKGSGLRWVSLMLLNPISWTNRIWALPFLTVLAPSKRYAQEHDKQHKKVTDWARQMLFQVRRWLPEREIVIVADSSYAVIEFLAAVREKLTFITRLRLDAALYEPAPDRIPGRPGRNRKKGERLPNLENALENPKTEWQKVTLSQWYGQSEKEFDTNARRGKSSMGWFYGFKVHLIINQLGEIINRGGGPLCLYTRQRG